MQGSKWEGLQRSAGAGEQGICQLSGALPLAKRVRLENRQSQSITSFQERTT